MWFEQVAFELPFDCGEYLLVCSGADIWPPDETYALVKAAAPDLVSRALVDADGSPCWALLQVLAIEEHPRNMNAEELREPVARRLQGPAAPRLMRRVRPIRNLMLAALPARATPPPPKAEPPARGYVVVEVVTEQEDPVPGVRCELALNNGEVRSATSDPRGRIALDPSVQGCCRNRLLELDAGSWK